MLERKDEGSNANYVQGRNENARTFDLPQFFEFSILVHGVPRNVVVCFEQFMGKFLEL